MPENTETPAPRSAFARFVRRLRRDEKGVTAVEFALIAVPFFALIIALLEVALIHLTTLDLENALKDASREIRTGQAQTANMSESDFRTLLCNRTVLIPNCSTNGDLTIDVRTFGDFGSITLKPSDIYDADGNWTGDQEYQPGAGLAVVAVRVFYKMQLLAQFPLIGLANLGSTHRMIDAITVFRNEPFS